MAENWLRAWVRKAGWAMLAFACVMQLGGLVYFVDSDPFRAVAADRVRVVPDDAPTAKAIQEGKLVVEVKAFGFTRIYGDVLCLALLATLMGIGALRWTEPNNAVRESAEHFSTRAEGDG